MSSTRTYLLSGSSVRRVHEGDYGADNDTAESQTAMKKLSDAPYRRRGRGYIHVVELTDVEADDLANYLQGIADVLASMTVAERGESGGPEMRACAEAARRLLVR